MTRGLIWSLVGQYLSCRSFRSPLAPVNSGWWNAAIKLNDDLPEEIGWPELVETVARIRDSLPEMNDPVWNLRRQLWGSGSDQSLRRALRPAAGDKRHQLLLATRLRRAAARNADCARVLARVRGTSLSIVGSGCSFLEPIRRRKKRRPDIPTSLSAAASGKSWPEFWRLFSGMDKRPQILRSNWRYICARTTERMRKLGIRDVDLVETFARSADRWTKCKQGFDGGDAAALAIGYQRDGPRFAIASAKSQTRAHVVGCNRTRAKRESARRDCATGKGAPPPLARAHARLSTASGIETQARRIKRQRGKIDG